MNSQSLTLVFDNMHAHSSLLGSYKKIAKKKKKLTVSREKKTSTRYRQILLGVFFLSVIFEGRLAAHQAREMAAQKTTQEKQESLERALPELLGNGVSIGTTV